MATADPITTQVFVKETPGAMWEYLGSDLDVLNKPEFHVRLRFQPRFPSYPGMYFVPYTYGSATMILNRRLLKVQHLLKAHRIPFEDCFIAFREQFSHLCLDVVLDMFEAEATAYCVLPTGRPLPAASAALSLLDVRIFVPGPAPALWSFVLTLMILVGVALS